MFSPKFPGTYHVPLPPGSRYPRANGHVRRAGSLQRRRQGQSQQRLQQWRPRQRQGRAPCTAGSTTRTTCCWSPRSAQLSTSPRRSAGDYNPVDYHPQYWFLNGLSFPNTIHVGLPGANGWSDWIAAHPGYDPFITGSVSNTSADGTKGEKVLIRMINMGYETQPMHMHGYHGKVIGSDQRAWYWANSRPERHAVGQGLEKNTLTIGSGETYEWLVDFGQQSRGRDVPGRNSDAGMTRLRTCLSATRRPRSPAIPDPSGPPYIGGPTVTGAVGIPAARARCSRSTTTTTTRRRTTASIRAACSRCSCHRRSRLCRLIDAPWRVVVTSSFRWAEARAAAHPA